MGEKSKMYWHKKLNPWWWSGRYKLLEKERDGLQQKLDPLTRERDKLVADHKKLKADHKDLGQTNEALREQVKELQTQLHKRAAPENPTVEQAIADLLAGVRRRGWLPGS